MHILMVESVVSIAEARNKAGESVFMAAAKHGNTHVFNMLTDIGSVRDPFQIFDRISTTLLKQR